MVNTVMTMLEDGTILFENARIKFKNLSGREVRNKGRVINEEGKRNFSLIINQEQADILRRMGVNVKTYIPEDPEREPEYSIKVNATYTDRSTTEIYMVTRKKKTLLSADSVGTLDSAEIANVDMIVRLWMYDPETMLQSVYVKSMYVKIKDDILSSRYQFDEDNQPAFE